MVPWRNKFYFLVLKTIFYSLRLFIKYNRKNYIIRKLHGGFKKRILFSCVKNNILLTALVRNILFIPLENKICIFALPCDILYVNKGTYKYLWYQKFAFLKVFLKYYYDIKRKYQRKSRIYSGMIATNSNTVSLYQCRSFPFCHLPTGALTEWPVV